MDLAGIHAKGLIYMLQLRVCECNIVSLDMDERSGVHSYCRLRFLSHTYLKQSLHVLGYHKVVRSKLFTITYWSTPHSCTFMH